MNPLLQCSATEVARLIREKKYSAEEVVETHIHRLQEANQRTNAVVATRLDDARREAKAADRTLRREGPEAVGPLHGVPFTIKESFEVAGMPHTAGAVARKGTIGRASHEATAVRRLKKAGAIALGVTNIAEYLMWMESNNQLYGRTRNAYDPKRIAGGSSGGEGASVGSGIVPFGLGADIGGSIRLPAFFNGVFGHKPSAGLVPTTGQWPMPAEAALDLLCFGPLTRRAEDLWPLLKILAGPDGQCTVCQDLPLKRTPAAVHLDALRVFNVTNNGLNAVAEDLQLAQGRAVDHLSMQGAAIEDVRIAALKRSVPIWASVLSAAGGESFESIMGEGQDVSLTRKMLGWAIGRSSHSITSLALVGLERLSKKGGRISDALCDEGVQLRKDLQARLGDDGVMLYPSYSNPAPYHNRPLLRPLDWGYTAIINVLGFPSTQVPLGFNEAGVPVGVQVIAAHGNDHLCIAVAEALERAFGGWTLPVYA